MLRLTIWLLFIPTAVATAFWLAGSGYGSYGFAVFYGWAALALTLGRNVGVGNTNTVAGVAFLLTPIVYPTCLFLASRYVVQRKGLTFYSAVIALHAVGAVLAAARLHYGLPPSAASVLSGCWASVVILGAFFGLDYTVLAHQSQSDD